MRITTIIISLLIASHAFAQNSPSIVVTGFIDQNKVLLRWAPNRHISWQQNNVSGYSVYRKTVIVNGKIVDNPDSILLAKVKPLSLELWEKHSDSSTFAIAAETIYGGGFEVSTKSQSFIDLVNKSNEQESRYSIGLLCADKSFTVACYMGLGLIDSSINTNETYLYKVISNYSDSSSVAENGSVLIDFKLGNILPRPFGISFRIDKNQVTLHVPYDPFRGIYNNFEVDRSTDGVNFKTIVGSSYYTMSTTDNQPQIYVYNDSISDKATSHFYRVRGKTSFDKFGPYSDTIEIKNRPSIDDPPWITEIKEFGDKIIISWDILTDKNVEEFKVYSSNNQNGPFSAVISDSLSKESRHTYVIKPHDYSYYRIAAIDNSDRKYFSTSRLFQTKDSIPPKPPIELKGQFDSTGTVTLFWKRGEEPDLLGYQVLYSLNSESEYSLMTKEFVYDSTFKSAFPLNMLSSKMYFRVVAIDTRYNTSKQSESIELTKPDTIPPGSPLIMLVSDSTNLRKIKVSPSNSTDIANYSIFVIPENNKPNCEELFNGYFRSDTLISLNDYIDMGVIYCVATDKTGRKAVSNKIRINEAKSEKRVSLGFSTKNLIDEGVLEIIWDKNKMTGEILIYKRNNSNTYSLIHTAEANDGFFKDRHVQINSKYNYKLVYCLENGKVTSTSIDIHYK